MRRILLFVLLTALAVVALVACGGEEADPAVAFCAALTELNETGTTIVGLGEVADVAQIVQLGAAMDNNWRDLSSAAEDMDDSTQSDFAPYDEQYTSIPAITQETALPIARASLEQKNSIATEAYSALYPANCQ
jgi:hypothetical protein